MLEGKNYYEKPDLQLLRAIGQLIKININSQCPFSQPSTTDPKLNTQEWIKLVRGVEKRPFLESFTQNPNVL